MAAILAVTMGVANAAQIDSTGPLTEVHTTPDLNCQVLHDGDSKYSFFGSNLLTAGCGTYVTDGTTLYGPESTSAGITANGTTIIAWTPVSQVGPTGSGTAGDPFKVVTKVTGGPFSVTQTDTYVLGQEQFRTQIQVTSSTAVDAIVYRAGDCYLQDSDSGGAALDLGIAPTCTATPSATDPNRIMQFYPLTGPSNYIVDRYSAIWDAVASMDPLPDTLQSGNSYDNAMAVSWSKHFAAGGTAMFSHLTTMSPTGARPLSVTKTVTPGEVAPGEEVTYTIKIENPGPQAIDITEINDTLPAGFAYVAGSTTGATTADPTISGSTLNWPVATSVPGADAGNPGSVSLSFTATASETPGTYTNSATAVATDALVIDAVDVAPVVVTGSNGSTTTTSSTTTSSTTPDTTVPDTTVAPAPTTAPSTIAPATTARVDMPARPTGPASPAAAVPAQPAYTG